MSADTSRRPTLSYVAGLTGYSSSTVSRALKKDPRVKEATRNEIIKVAEDVGFSQNALASSLRSGGVSTLLGLIVPNVLDPFYAAVVGGVQDAAANQSRDVIIGCHQDSESVQKHILQQMLRHRVQAILIVPVNSGVPKLLQAQSKFGTVIVALDSPIVNLDSDVVTTQNEKGVRRLTRALIERGHEKIAVVTLDQNIYTQRLRLAAIENSLQEVGIPDGIAHVLSTDHHGGIDPREIDDVLSASEATAVLSTAVMPLVRVLESMERVERSFDLASFDSHPFFELLNTPILTVEQDPYEIGRAAISLLNERKDKPYAPIRRVELPIGPLRVVAKED